MKIAVFHHAVLHTPLQDLGDMALEVLIEQMAALKDSGLAAAATEIHLCINESDQLLLASLAPDKAVIHSTGDGSEGEKPTMMIMEKWVPGHDGWFVLYHHMKGCTNGKHVARHCMEEACVFHWRRCVADLQRGYDAVGCHWLDYRTHPIPHGHRIFGGNFWWATQKHLATLPPLDPKVNNGRYYEGEIWIGRGPGNPKIKDYHPRGRACAL